MHALVLDLFEAARLGLGAPVSDSAIEHQQVEVPGVIVRIDLEGPKQGFLCRTVFSQAEADEAELCIGIGVIGMGCERLFHCLKRLRKLSFLSGEASQIKVGSDHGLVMPRGFLEFFASGFKIRALKKRDSEHQPPARIFRV